MSWTRASSWCFIGQHACHCGWCNKSNQYCFLVSAWYVCTIVPSVSACLLYSTYKPLVLQFQSPLWLNKEVILHIQATVRGPHLHRPCSHKARATGSVFTPLSTVSHPVFLLLLLQHLKKHAPLGVSVLSNVIPVQHKTDKHQRAS